MVNLLSTGFAAAALALCMSSINIVRGEELCSIPPQSYVNAKTDNPELAFALSAVEEYSIAAWYTDRLSTTDRARMLKDLTTQCSEDSRMTIVVYGIPSKDCNAGYSSGGSVSNTADYTKFLSELTTAVGDRKVLYVVEPDSVGLLADNGGCGKSAGYLDNLKVAIKALSANTNAELYVDVGYWTLQYEEQRSTVVTIMKDLATAGKLKGITINTSNYRTTAQVTELCTNFQTAMGSKTMNCILDTSRNYVAPTTTDWCNVMEAGIGSPPTSETNVSNLDYFMWIKPPGESDGTCSGGPDAGAFFKAGFQNMWDKGYFVKEKGMNTIAEGGTDTTPSTTKPSPPKDNTASQTQDNNPSQTASSQSTDDSASESTAQTTPEDTDSSASQTAEQTTPEVTDSSASQTAEQTTPEVTDSSASQTAEQTTSSPATDDNTSQTTQSSDSTGAEADTTSSQSDTTVPTSTTATPTETTATPTETTPTPASTEAPSSKCKVKRRLRKF